MLCPKCGANNPENVKFCGVCGELLKRDNSESQPVIYEPLSTKKKNNKVIVVVASVITVIMAVAVLAFAFWPKSDSSNNSEKESSNTSIESAIRSFLVSVIKGDSQKTVDCIYLFNDEHIIENVIEEIEDNKEYFFEELEDECGENARLAKVEIVHEKSINAESQKYDELVESLESFAEYYDADFNEKDIKEVKIVEIKFTISGDYNDDSIRLEDLYFVKTSDGWQLTFASAGQILDYIGY